MVVVMDTSSYLSLPNNVEGGASSNPPYMPGFTGSSMDTLLAQLAEAREKIRHQEATIANLLTQNNHHVQTILNQQVAINHQIQAFKDLGAIRAQPSMLEAIRTQRSGLDEAISNQLQPVKDLVTVPSQTGGAATNNSFSSQGHLAKEVGSVRLHPSNSVINHTLNYTNQVEDIASPEPSYAEETTADPPETHIKSETKTRTKVKGKPKSKIFTKNVRKGEESKQNSSSNGEAAPYGEAAPSASHNKRRHRSSEPRAFTCDRCSKVFTHKGHFNRHVATHTGERRYVCDVCNKAFAQGWHLERHKRGHTQERPFKCEVCGKPFGDISHLAAHKRIHLEEKPYKCTDCGRSFAHHNTLKTHKRTHTNEKPYNCSTCEMKFTTSSQLNTHKKVHVIMEGVERRRTMRRRKMNLLKPSIKVCSKEFLCVVCNEGFDLRDELNAHMSVHEEPSEV